ncbi:hypothetical protein C8R45DRAFT_1213630 [Mycena sanguinolenta]|nr:hypothetical protein C8R45DRAFT_1213630 [Mycena sanguinolenta]
MPKATRKRARKAALHIPQVNAAPAAPRFQQLTQLPEHPVPEAIDAHLKFRTPGSTRQQRAEAFNGLKNACWMPGTYDLTTADLKTASVGPLTIFYHANCPPHLQKSAVNGFMWNFYIGDRPDRGSIMPGWDTKGINVQLKTDFGWKDCGKCLTVLPSSRVQISFPFGGKARLEEIIFPPAPWHSHVPVQLLQ